MREVGDEWRCEARADPNYTHFTAIITVATRLPATILLDSGSTIMITTYVDNRQAGVRGQDRYYYPDTADCQISDKAAN